MELHQLQYFVAVAEEASFTRAAARVHVAQPGVSAQIRRLEKELGQALFDRSGRSVRLTEVGAAVLPQARAALDAVAGVRLVVEQLAGLLRGRVTLGMVSACTSPLLPELLAQFHDLHPGVDIALMEANSDRLVEMLRDGHLDLALIGSAGSPPPEIQTGVVADEALVAAVSHGGPLAARKTITIETLRDQPLISLPRGTGVRTALEQACAAAGFTPQVVLEASSPPVLAQFAARGLGIAILPTSTANTHRETLHALVIRPSPRARLELAWRVTETGSPAARALVDRARSCLRHLATNRHPVA